MRFTTPLIVPVAAVLTHALPGQFHPMGFDWDLDATTLLYNPQTFGFAEGDFLTRIDTDDYSSWGRDPTVDPTYATTCITSVQFLVGDPLDPCCDPNDPNSPPFQVTPESDAWLVAWTEDPNNPNFPDVPGFDPITGGSQFVFAGPFNTPFQFTVWTATFLDPVCIATEGDLFVGLNIGPESVGEGLFVPGLTDGTVPLASPPSFDDPGPAGAPGASIAEDSYACIVPTLTLLGGLPEPTGVAAIYTPFPAQNWMEVFLTNASGGVVTAVTNQASFPTSNPASGNGTSSFLSGLHPDASSDPRNLGRNLPPPAGWTGDRIGFRYFDHRIPAGNPVAVVVSFAEQAPPLPIDAILGPGSTGQVLVDITFSIPKTVGSGVAVAVAQDVGGGTIVNYSTFDMSIDLTPGARLFLETNHPTLFWQGVGLDGSGNLHLTGLAKQHF